MWSLKSGEDCSNLVFTERAPVVFSGWRGSQQVTNFNQENILLWNCSMSYLTGLWLVEACSKLMTMKVPLNLCLTTSPLRTFAGCWGWQRSLEVIWSHPQCDPLWSGRASQAQLPRTMSRWLLCGSKDEMLSPFPHLLWWQRQKVWLFCCWQILHVEIRNWGREGRQVSVLVERQCYLC